MCFILKISSKKSIFLSISCDHYTHNNRVSNLKMNIIILSLIVVYICGATTARYLLIDVDDEGDDTDIGKHTSKNHLSLYVFDFFIVYLN